VILQVRVAHIVIAANEGAGLEVIGGAKAFAEQQPLQPDAQLIPWPGGAVEGDGLRAGVLDVDLQVILQITTDPRQVRAHVDPEFTQDIAIADTGEHQQLWRINGAAAQ
jgi:hypothetical protein